MHLGHIHTSQKRRLMICSERQKVQEMCLSGHLILKLLEIFCKVNRLKAMFGMLRIHGIYVLYCTFMLKTRVFDKME